MYIFTKITKQIQNFVRKNAITANLPSEDGTFECQMSPNTKIQLRFAVTTPSIEFKDKYLWIVY